MGRVYGGFRGTVAAPLVEILKGALIARIEGDNIGFERKMQELVESNKMEMSKIAAKSRTDAAAITGKSWIDAEKARHERPDEWAAMEASALIDDLEAKIIGAKGDKKILARSLSAFSSRMKILKIYSPQEIKKIAEETFNRVYEAPVVAPPAPPSGDRGGFTRGLLDRGPGTRPSPNEPGAFPTDLGVRERVGGIVDRIRNLRREVGANASRVYGGGPTTNAARTLLEK